MFRTGIGYDSHRFAEGRKLVLGGVAIPSEKGLAGHSDADVLIHALIDALLGSVADGDIGSHFPDTDETWRGADSRELLKSVVDELRAKGWRIVNTDASVLAERPKLRPYIDTIRASLAQTLGIDVSRVSVKAKTNEGMDAVGRGEGIGVFAVASVESEGKGKKGNDHADLQ